MKYIGLYLMMTLVYLQVNAQNSVYDLSVRTTDGDTISLSIFQGKKILIVETASQDSTFSQYSDLLSLSERFRESLVVIVFPTNSFGSEPLDSSQLSQAYGVGTDIFKIATKINVAGPDIDPIYTWLTTATLNGVIDASVNGPFKKFLLDKDGHIIGVYASKVSPMDTVLFEAVNTDL